MPLRAPLFAAGFLISGFMLAQATVAQSQKFFAYNMTTRTDFKGVYLAPAGSENWSSNQTENDKDKSLDITERLQLTGLTPGRYDVKLVTEDGGSCIVKDVDLTKENSFVIKEDQIAGCHKSQK
jgi:hypothetical protein